MRAPGRLGETPSQTAGPYVHVGCMPNHCGVGGVYPRDLGASMVSDRTRGERITVAGSVLDGTGAPLRDALVEIWQADADGIYPRGDPRGRGDPEFAGWGRAASDGETGEWSFETIRPGAVPFPDGRMMAPHITFWIVARGINIGLQTRMYFPGDPMLAGDPWLAGIEHKDRVATLVARESAPAAFRFDIRLQGPGETVFFDA